MASRVLRSIVASAAATISIESGSQNPSHAQQRSTFRARTTLVTVDVVVVDRHGEPVRRLMDRDFTIVDGKQPQTTATFAEVDHAPTSVVDSITSSGSDRTHDQIDRLVTIVVDDLHLFEGRSEVARTLVSRVIHDIGPNAAIALHFTSDQHGTPLTNDRRLLLEASTRLTGRRPYRRPTEAARGDPEFFGDMAQYHTVGDIAQSMAKAGNQRKAIVLISEGIAKNIRVFPMRPTQAVPSGRADVAPTVTPDAARPPAGHYDEAQLRMMDSLRSHGVTLYVIDPRGAVTANNILRECYPPPAPRRPPAADDAVNRKDGQVGARPSPPPELRDDPCFMGTDWRSAVRIAQRGLELTAETTGGFAVTNTDDFATGVARVISALDHYYLLGFYPSQESRRGVRPIDVRVNRSDVIIRFRRGYQPAKDR